MGRFEWGKYKYEGLSADDEDEDVGKDDDNGDWVNECDFEGDEFSFWISVCNFDCENDFVCKECEVNDDDETDKLFNDDGDCGYDVDNEGDIALSDPVEIDAPASENETMTGFIPGTSLTSGTTSSSSVSPSPRIFRIYDRVHLRPSEPVKLNSRICPDPVPPDPPPPSSSGSLGTPVSVSCEALAS